MTIFFDHQTFTDQVHGGVSRYFAELIAGVDEHPDHQAHLGVWRTNNEYIRHYRPETKGFLSKQYVPKKKQILRWFNKRRSTSDIKHMGLDVYHPTGYNPYLLNELRNRPMVVTFYDMIHEKLGQNNELSKDRKTLNYKQMMARRADKIISISEKTKLDIIEILNVPAEKIDVIHLASSMPVIKSESVLANVAQKPYLLYVGTRRHYKNFDTFLIAAAPLLTAYSINIICAGSVPFSGFEVEAIRQAGITKYVHHVPISDDQLIKLYHHAIGFVFPSQYEGFGIPVLEAFSCGCPCLLSHGGSLPEVGGDAALYFDPASADSMRMTIKMLLDNSELRKTMIERGFERAQLFSWQKAVDKTLSVYKSLR